MQKITPCLWFDKNGEEAAKHYVSVFPNSKILHVERYGDSGAQASGIPKGSVMTVTFSLDGNEFMALNGGPHFKHSEAVSFMIECENQKEVDHYYSKLSAVPQSEMCGWLKDKFGLSWQIIPKDFTKIMSGGDPKKKEKFMAALMKMKRVDMNLLEKIDKENSTPTKNDSKPITVQTIVNKDVKSVWNFWNEPKHITKWNHASDDWHSPKSTNDLRTGGKFSTRMEAKDGSAGFDFGGVYSNVVPQKLIEYKMGDGRKVKVEFLQSGNSTKVVETFDPEKQNSTEMQKSGWQAILNNFKKYSESQKG